MSHPKNLALAIGFMLLFIPSASISSQTFEEIVFGDIPPEDLALTQLESDTSADAYVLHDQVNHEIYKQYNSYEILTTIHRRVKLFQSSSFDRADVEIEYFTDGEKVKNLQATIYLPDGQTFELDRRDIIREEIDDDNSIVKFTFPQVTEGAIIEYKYELESEYFIQTKKHYFQEDIPVRRSVFDAYAEAATSFVAVSNCFEEMCINQKLNITGSDRIRRERNRREGTLFRFEICDIPGFDIEPYISNIPDYLPYAFLQLSSYLDLGSFEMKNYLGTWNTAANYLINHDNIGERFLNSAQAARLADRDMYLFGSTQFDKAQQALNIVNSNMEWNGEYGFGTDEQLKDLWEKGSANSGAINMMLLVILKDHDIEARPVLTGLRNYGRPIMDYPIIRQFQHLMVLANLDGVDYLLDANGYRSEVGLPREEALNEAAWVFDEDTNYWIDVEAPLVTDLYRVSGQLQADGYCQFHIQNQSKQYIASNAYEDLMDENDVVEGPVIDALLKKYPDSELIERQYAAWTDPTKPFNLNLDVRAQIGQPLDDFLYTQLVLIDVFTSDLVDDDERLFPIDFTFPFKQIYIAEFDLPEGYTVDEMPESSRVRSPDGSINVQFMMAHNEAENKISVNLTVRVAASMYPANQYGILREIFQRVIDIQDSMVVLKRIN
ncbi:MAG: DUF3857 domain-containing protein [Bacteroidota bacterium]